MTRVVTNRIKELRKQAGFTQQELANQLGVIRKTVWNWENGVSRINPIHTEALATIFQVSVADLLGIDTQEGSDSDLSHWIAYTNRQKE